MTAASIIRAMSDTWFTVVDRRMRDGIQDVVDDTVCPRAVAVERKYVQNEVRGE